MIEGWKQKPVEEICERVSVGIVIKPSQYYVDEGQGVRAFRSANVAENRIVDENWVYLSPEGHAANAKSCLRTGDVLVVRSGAPGTACVVTPEFQGSNCIDVVFARPNPKAVLPEYLAEYTNSAVGKQHVLGNKGGLALQHFNVGAYKEMLVLLPPLPEQRKIVEILRTWDEAIEKLEALRAANEGRYKALARRFFDPCHPTFHGRPNTWREFELGDVFRERNQSGEEHDRLLSITMNGGVIDRDDVGRKDTSTDDKSKYKLILPGDIGYNTMRMWQGVSGLSTLRGIISPAYTVVTPIHARILGRYAAHLFKSRRMVFDFERYSQGLTSDTWNLKFPAFSKIRVFLPPIDDQEKQADLLDALTAEGVVIGKQLEALTRQKRGLMQKLLTGEWRVSP
ncbi:restriction endonuclease subunit S [Prosthecodimorpha staleyi]|uniref:Restriction endonuclease subunit S n=1 Tax=Prosthecodimorpha staleyi TaxID=2840188 RepID=A0A947GED6_9HYPH|nr:restriction endonuclease subunit S [Prosthecodimorpha staleyi]MBT9291812.1 restriction endonuclease subunit S [Prosthecodimorpha staleyi]